MTLGRTALWITAVLIGATGIPEGQAPAPGPEAQSSHPRHAMRVTLDPGTHLLTVVDRITLPDTGRDSAEFVLNGKLRITRSVPAVSEVPLADAAAFSGINSSSAGLGSELKRYRVDALSAGRTLEVEYAGPIDFGLSDQKEEYTRGFRETAGILDSRGVYLAGNGVWYPQFADDLLEFSLEVAAPAGWHVISQGSGTSGRDDGRARWDSGGPMDEIYLVGGPLVVTRDTAGPVETLVYLHEPDPALAAKYLTTAAQYLEMYRTLIGPYPYTKFALVENFWETGYGMPSFTLLGPEVIRFPFILHSSFPHEILHNWWGNSVFVDYASGNWAEGLTAYLADHLVQEQRGTADQYRRSALQKYRSYVKDGRDFALTEFRSRESAATEAVGYGKTLMAFHMLRRQLGDDWFRGMLADLYRTHRGRRASFSDVRRVAEKQEGSSLARFFDDWIGRAGAPALAVDSASLRVRSGGDGFVITGRIEQTQPGPPYRLSVPIVVQTDKDVERSDLVLDAPSATFEIETVNRPRVLHVDPYFDLFRRLDPRETPPSIGQIFGEPQIVAFLPSGETPERLAAYRQLLETWQTPSHRIDIRLDSEPGSLPPSTSMWLLGRNNRMAREWLGNTDNRPAGLDRNDDTLVLDGQSLPFAGHTAVVVGRHPGDVEKAIGWIAIDPPAALPGLGRKLPHYGKYSYVGFEGDEPANVLSGQWQDADSPLRVDLRPPDDRTGRLPALPPDPARPLATLPLVFSQTTMMETVTTLAAAGMEGRGIGTTGLEQAADWIAERFKSYGLTPGGDRNTYFQRFTIPQGPGGAPQEAINIVGYLPGTRADWAGQSAVVSAHYDHLGRGWPDVHAGDAGRVHPGADDNASGVAVLLELARVMASGEKPMRTLVFVAFSGEEAGLRGSRHFVDHPPFPLDRIIGVVNLDTVGRLFDQRVSVLGTGTATEWQHIFRGAGFVTGIEGRNVAESLESSDQVPFVERGVPAVQVFTGAHGDYHRPGDTPDRIDGAGLVKVAAFVKEVVAYLAERPEALTVTITNRPTAPPSAPTGTQAGRRVSFGTVPDFGFPGPGVRVEGVVEGSPAASAGVRAGDVVLAIDGKPVPDLQGYAAALRELTPGQTISVDLQRGDERLTIRVVVVAR